MRRGSEGLHLRPSLRYEQNIRANKRELLKEQGRVSVQHNKTPSSPKRRFVLLFFPLSRTGESSSTFAFYAQPSLLCVRVCVCVCVAPNM